MSSFLDEIAREGRRRRRGCRSTKASRSCSSPTSSRSAQLANEVRERLPRRSHLLQPEHAHRGDQRLRRRRASSARSRKLEEGTPGAHTMKRRGSWRELEVRMDDPPTDRDPHRQRPAPRAAVLVLRGAARAASSASSRDMHMKCFTAVEIHFFAEHYGMTHREVLERLARRASTACPGGGAEIFHPRACGAHLARQGDGRRVARGPPRRAPARHAHERDDALRAHRDLRAPRRSPAAPARAAGRDRRLPGLHPARLPPRRQRDEEPARADGRRRSAHASPSSRLHARQRPSHQGVLGRARRRGRADRAALRRRRRRRHHRPRDDLQAAGSRVAATRSRVGSWCGSSARRGASRSSATRSTTSSPRAPRSTRCCR